MDENLQNSLELSKSINSVRERGKLNLLGRQSKSLERNFAKKSMDFNQKVRINK